MYTFQKFCSVFLGIWIGLAPSDRHLSGSGYGGVLLIHTVLDARYSSAEEPRSPADQPIPTDYRYRSLH